LQDGLVGLEPTLELKLHPKRGEWWPSDLHIWHGGVGSSDSPAQIVAETYGLERKYRTLVPIVGRLLTALPMLTPNNRLSGRAVNKVPVVMWRRAAQLWR
jgi:hypothetical protein